MHIQNKCYAYINSKKYTCITLNCCWICLLVKSWYLHILSIVLINFHFEWWIANLVCVWLICYYHLHHCDIQWAIRLLRNRKKTANANISQFQSWTFKQMTHFCIFFLNKLCDLRLTISQSWKGEKHLSTNDFTIITYEGVMTMHSTNTSEGKRIVEI